MCVLVLVPEEVVEMMLVEVVVQVKVMVMEVVLWLWYCCRWC